MEHHRPSKELLLQPLPLELPGVAGKEFKRTLSVQTANRSREEPAKEKDKATLLAPLPTGKAPMAVHVRTISITIYDGA